LARRYRDVPRYAYPLAVVGGLCYTGVAFAAASYVAEFDRGMAGPSLLGLLTFAAAHLCVGGLFGLLWPERTWRWGVWLCAVPVCLLPWFDSDVWAFFLYLALTLAPACAGAYAAARVHLKYVEAG
jgi:hypothetical protein